MSLRIHFLQTNLIFFPENCGAVSDEYGERLHQLNFLNGERISSEMEQCHPCQLLLDFTRVAPTMEYMRQAKRKKYMIFF
jgi:hypothetical protein